MLALIRYNVVAKLEPRRWGILFLLFVGLAVIYVSDIRSEASPGQARVFNVWDVGLCVLFDYFIPSIVFLLGFVMLAGDELIAGRADGTLQITLLRSRSILRWWLAKILSWGILALCFMAVFLLATAVASLLCSVPLELRSSPASAESHHSFSRWYLIPPRWPTMAYDIAVACYMAASLWVLFTLYMALALLVFPDLFLSYVFFFCLYGASLWITGRTSMLSVAFFLSPAKHFSGLGHAPIPLRDFVGLLAGLLLSASTTGYLKLRRLQL